MSKVVNRISLGLALAIGAGLVAVVYQSDPCCLEDFAETIALKLMEYLPRKHHNVDTVQSQVSCPPIETSSEQKSSIPPSKESIFNPVGHYNAKKAMQKRHDGLKAVCKKYSDFLRPEYSTTKTTPKPHDFVYNVKSNMAFCPIKQVGSESYKTLFNRVKEINDDASGDSKHFFKMFPKSARETKRAIMVRHPFERLISAYRYNFEQSLNALTNEVEGGDVEFLDFVYLLLEGPLEFANILEENDVVGESVALDTGLLDGLGTSVAWNPYWRQCGVCNPFLTPHYILHMDHYKEDAEVLIELMGRPENGKAWLEVQRENKSGWKEVEEFYFSQLTKSQVMDLYDKYKLDFELFGFTPDYYLAMAKGDENKNSGTGND